MKIDPADYLTLTEAQAAIGCSRRGLARAIERCGRENCTVKILGKTVVPRAKLEAIRQHYYPYYSEQHQAMVREWGRRGGAQKAINAQKSSRSRGGESGSADAQA